MTNLVYDVQGPTGKAYRYSLEIRDPPIVATRGDKTLTLDAEWVAGNLDELMRNNNNRAQSVVVYFLGYVRSLSYLGVLGEVSYEGIPRAAPPAASAPKKDEPTPRWAAWQKVGE